MNAPQAKPWIEAIAPYVPGRSTTDDGRKVAKLSSNENPFGTPEAAAAAYVRESGTLHRYPDASAAALREALAAKYGLDPARVIYGTGSEDRTSVVEGKSVSVRVDLGGRRSIKKNKNATVMKTKTQ